MIQDDFSKWMKWTSLEIDTKSNVYLTEGENYNTFKAAKNQRTLLL
jgi:hypothetical protein